jgi:predicted TIM-barrel fold metal-dependent hydrolase
MDDMGIYAHVMYQNTGVTQAGSLMSLKDPELALTIIQIFNDAASDRQVESGQRLFSLASLPYWDKAVMDKEARRCVEDLKLKGFVLPDRPERMGIPGFTDPYWAEFFELCSATKTPINFHLSSGVDGVASAWPDFSFEQKLAIMAMVVSINNCSTMGNFMVSGLLDKYPDLHIGLIESGMGWIPFAIEALDHQFKEMMPHGIKKLQRRPWEYFRDQFWCTFWFETSGPLDLLDRIGVNKVLFETDFPHPTSLYPGVQEHLAVTLGGYSYDVRKRVLERNAAELYNLPF